jgi:diguanylate cyclase (GGDEF)-like protein
MATLLATVAWSPRSLAAAPTEMLFARLGDDAGLSQGAVMSIVQDAQGYMWFGTEDGLDRYDGYELRHYIHKRNDPETPPNNWVPALAVDASGRMWIGTDGGGLVWRDDRVGQFSRTNVPRGILDPEGKVRALHADRSGRLWIATRGAGVEALDLAQETVREFRHDAADPASLCDDTVLALADDAAGSIWMGTANGLDRLDPSTGRIEHFAARLKTAPDQATVRVNALFVDAAGVLWIGMDSGLAKLDLRTGALDLLLHRDGDAAALPNGRVTALLEDDAQRLWVGTSDGLALLDRKTNRFFVVRHDATDLSSLPDSGVTALYQDRSGLLWIGTKGGAIARWNPRSWGFGHHRFSDENANNVTSFAVDHHGVLWVGSVNDGVGRVDPNGVMTRYRHDTRTAPLTLPDDSVMSLVIDGRDRLWVGTMTGGIVSFDSATGTTRHFASFADDPATLPAPGIMSMLLDSHGELWVGTFGGGLARIDPDTGHVVRYAHGSGGDTSLSGDRATALGEDRRGLIWIGTDGGGLNVLNPKTGRFKHYLHDPQDPLSLSGNTVYALHVDAAGGVWVGTRGAGLDRVVGSPFDGKPLTFENLSETDGLPNSTVYGIESDARGVLWLSTNRGLAAVQRDYSVRRFRRSHGLQGDEFNFGAHYRAPDGTLYFGGTNGYNAFQSQQLQFNERPPPVVFTQILKLNKPVSPVPETLHHLDLGYRDSVVTFQFAALDYSGSAENRYAYRLKGFDADWVNADASRQATYTNLDAGTYEFQVRAANSDGRWNETPITLELGVAPPPWASWWARTAYGVVLAAIFISVWSSQKRRLDREAAYGQRLKLEVEERTAELAERNRDMQRANEQLRAASVTDTLTGLGNRRYLHDAMHALLRNGGQQPPKFVLMVIDLDYLKPINDQYGHEGGDAVLIEIAEILRRELRPSDIIVRWGGDEFVVMCKDVDLSVAGALAERVRTSVAKRIFRIGEGTAARTSCSIGFSAAPFVPEHPDALDWEQTLAIADLALYHAKRERNTWMGWSGTSKLLDCPSIPAALNADPVGLEAAGLVVVTRRPWNPDETVDNMHVVRR